MGANMSHEMSSPIQLESVSKCYRLFQNPQDRFKQALLDRLNGALGWWKASPLYREHWALRDISFELAKGEAVGILGRNGAGKSTLLQIIAGTLAPTHGQVRTAGRITALLELGSGFNLEFTGRENVLLNAQVLGLSQEDTLALFDDIASFADIGDFIDQPSKTYSSGMLMRLAFAVQTVLNPDILIVDEALSVGDAKFQSKCFRKLQSLRDRGTTILFVSHDVNSVTSFCDRALLLDAGQLIESGIPLKVANKYIELLYGDEKESGDSSMESAGIKDSHPDAAVQVQEDDDIVAPTCVRQEHRFGNNYVEILDVGIFDQAGTRSEILISGKSYRVTQRVVAHRSVNNLSSGFIIRDKRGLDIFGVTNKTVGVRIPELLAGDTFEVSVVVDAWLAAGDYFLQAANAGEDGTQYDCRIDAVHFTVIDTPQLFTTSIVNLSPRLSVDMIGRADQRSPEAAHG